MGGNEVQDAAALLLQDEQGRGRGLLGARVLLVINSHTVRQPLYYI